MGYRSETAGKHVLPRSAVGGGAAARRAAARKPEPSRQAQRVSSAKREQRERRQQLIRARRAGASVVLIAIVAGVAWGGLAITRLPVFGVQTVRVEGTRHLRPDAVLRLAQVREGSSLVWLPKRKIEARILANPWVSRVDIDRNFPDSVRIVVTERVPSVVIDAGGTSLWVVSTDGRWLGKRSAEESGVPVVRDVEVDSPKLGARVDSPEIRNVVEIVAGLSSELLGITRVISAPSIEKTALITVEDVEVFVGDASDIGKKDRIVRGILKAEKGKVVYINVRVVDSPTWRGIEE